MDDRWRIIPCYSCIRGLTYQGDECPKCHGSERIWIRPGGHCFAWPGGPARGMMSEEAYANAFPV